MMNMGKVPYIGFSCNNMYEVQDFFSLDKHGKIPVF